jgi:hypothetical protein
VTACTTPSPVSKLVARLERRLGTCLINRSTRKVLLTAEGEVAPRQNDIERGCSSRRRIGHCQTGKMQSTGFHSDCCKPCSNEVHR